MNPTELIAAILRQEGVQWLACYPSNPLIEAAATCGIRPIAFRHERGAIMAADGFSRVSDRQAFGVVAVQSQAGAENSMGGLAQANADNVPILVLPGGNPLDWMQVRPNFSATRAWESVVRQAEFIATPAATADVLRRAFHQLRSGPGGPVVVEMPVDVCAQSIPDRAADYHSPRPITAAPAPGAVADAARALVDATEPLLWAGSGVLRAGASTALRTLAELLEAPVYTSMPGKSAIDERHPLAVGAGGMTTTGPARHWLQHADLIFAIGSSLTLTPYGQRFPRSTRLIHGVDNIHEINKDTAADIGLIGDAALTLDAIIDAVRGLIGERPRGRDTAARVAAARKAWLDPWRPYLTSDTAPLSPYRVIGELEQHLDHDQCIVTHDAGAPRDQMLPFYTATTPHSYLGWGKTTHLGASIPLMIGAKLAHPERTCINLMGDGAFGMSGLDLETSARAGIPITTIVLNNGDMATYPGGFPTAREQFGVGQMQGDYAALATALGAVGLPVTQPAELGPAIRQAVELNNDGRTVLIDVHTRAEDSRAPDRLL